LDRWGLKWILLEEMVARAMEVRQALGEAVLEKARR